MHRLMSISKIDESSSWCDPRRSFWSIFFFSIRRLTLVRKFVIGQELRKKQQKFGCRTKFDEEKYVSSFVLRSTLGLTLHVCCARGGARRVIAAFSFYKDDTRRTIIDRRFVKSVVLHYKDGEWGESLAREATNRLAPLRVNKLIVNLTLQLLFSSMKFVKWKKKKKKKKINSQLDDFLHRCIGYTARRSTAWRVVRVKRHSRFHSPRWAHFSHAVRVHRKK